MISRAKDSGEKKSVSDFPGIIGHPLKRLMNNTFMPGLLACGHTLAHLALCHP